MNSQRTHGRLVHLKRDGQKSRRFTPVIIIGGVSPLRKEWIDHKIDSMLLS